MFVLFILAYGKINVKPGYVVACYTPAEEEEEFWLLKIVCKKGNGFTSRWFNKTGDNRYEVGEIDNHVKWNNIIRRDFSVLKNFFYFDLICHDGAYSLSTSRDRQHFY